MGEENLSLQQKFSLAEKDHRDLFASLAEQVSKDFSPHYEIEGGSQNLDQLVNVVSLAVKTLSEKQPEALMQIVYRVDVSERIAADAFRQSQNLQAAYHHVAVLIVIRCLQKVLTRKKFS